MVQLYDCKEKLDAGHSGFKGVNDHIQLAWGK